MEQTQEQKLKIQEQKLKNLFNKFKKHVLDLTEEALELHNLSIEPEDLNSYLFELLDREGLEEVYDALGQMDL